MNLLIGLALLFLTPHGLLGDEYHYYGGESVHYHHERHRREANGEVREDKHFWMKEGLEALEHSLNIKPNTNLAKNIIVVVGDGMSLPTVAATRVYKGEELTGKTGTISKLSWEHFPHFGLSQTYNTDALVSDSASTAFAIFSGVKTNYFTLGYDESIVRQDPFSMLNATQVDTVLKWAQDAGMATGIVTNTRVTHATPAALYAKTADRNWECDRKLPVKRPPQVMDISKQLVESEPGNKVDVILGGGRGSFTPAETEEQLLLFSNPNQLRSEISQFDCSRLDGEDLVETWKKKNQRGEFVQTKSELSSVKINETDKLFGLFSWSELPYEDELNTTLDIPSLEDMAMSALTFLQHKGDEKGYFLMVEGGRMDHAHHHGQAVRALRETYALDRTVEAMLKKIDLNDTLIIVTADHSHTMSFGGYPGRLANIKGVVKGNDGWTMKDLNGQQFPILSYANGPGFKRFRVKSNNNKNNWEAIERQDVLGETEYAEESFLQPSAVPLDKETHGGDDVGIWAAGPLSHLVQSTHQQSFIGHLMSLAACIGPHSQHDGCLENERP